MPTFTRRVTAVASALTANMMRPSRCGRCGHGDHHTYCNACSSDLTAVLRQHDPWLRR